MRLVNPTATVHSTQCYLRKLRLRQAEWWPTGTVHQCPRSKPGLPDCHTDPDSERGHTPVADASHGDKLHGGYHTPCAANDVPHSKGLCLPEALHRCYTVIMLHLSPLCWGAVGRHISQNRQRFQNCQSLMKQDQDYDKVPSQQGTVPFLEGKSELHGNQTSTCLFSVSCRIRSVA